MSSRTGPWGITRSGRDVPMRGAAGPRRQPGPLSMAQRKHQLVGLDIDPAGVAVAQVAVNGHVEVERAAFAELEPGRRPRRRGRRRGGPHRRPEGALARQQGPGPARPDRRRQPEGRRSASSSSRRRGPQGPRGGPALPGGRPDPDAARQRGPGLPPDRHRRDRRGPAPARRWSSPPAATWSSASSRRPQRRACARGRRPGRVRAGARPAPAGAGAASRRPSPSSSCGSAA